MDKLFQRLAAASEPIDDGFFIWITNRNGYEDFLFHGDGCISPDDIRIVDGGMLNTGPQAFGDSQKADVLGKTAAIENRIIAQAGIEAEKDHLRGIEKLVHGQSESFPFLLILAFNAQESKEPFPVLPHAAQVGIFPGFGKLKICPRGTSLCSFGKHFPAQALESFSPHDPTFPRLGVDCRRSPQGGMQYLLKHSSGNGIGFELANTLSILDGFQKFHYEAPCLIKVGSKSPEKDNEVPDDIRFVLSHDSFLEAEGIFRKAKKAPKRQSRPLRIKTEERPNRWAAIPEMIGPRVLPTA
jgi:hypothetical protein